MNALLVVGGLVVLWYLYRNGSLQGGLTKLGLTAAGTVLPCANIPKQIAPGQTEPADLSTFNGGALATSIATKGATVALGSGGLGLGAGLGLGGAALGAVTFGIGAIGALVAGIFAHHSAAVQREANTLNPLEPEIAAALAAVVNSYNSGQVDGPTCAQAMDMIVAQYQQAVSGIVKMGGQCSTDKGGASGFYNVGVNPCNSACDVFCMVTQGWIAPLKAAILSGKGGMVPLPGWAPSSSAKVAGFPSWSLTVRCGL